MCAQIADKEDQVMAKLDEMGINSDTPTITAKEISARTGLSMAALRNYTSGRYEPKLDATYQPTPQGLKAMVYLPVFEAWWAEYQAKKPFGSRLHKSRDGK